MPPGSSTLGFKQLLLWSLVIPVLGAQQQPGHHVVAPHARSDELQEKATSKAHELAVVDSLDTPLSGLRGLRDTHVDHTKQRSRLYPYERASTTLSPAEKAVGARPSTLSTRGITRQTARSLEDWQVEDIILLATVDGKIQARDRRTGARKWELGLESDRAMVETVYHNHNKSIDENGLEQEDPVWIVEPSQDGSMYLFAPGSGYGIQKLPFTVRELADKSPWAGEGNPAVAYTAEKSNTLYTLDARTGKILKVFSSRGSTVSDDNRCKRINPLESLEDDECEPTGTITLGRNDYTIGMHDRVTEQRISTIKFFEWVPNNYDADLKNQYNKPMDNKYIYTRHDGTIYGLEIVSNTGYKPAPISKKLFRQKLSAPIARVFDVVRPDGDDSSATKLVVLPQPVGPSSTDVSEIENDFLEKIFVNCSTDGSWYALSESKYPFVTEGAAYAKCYGDLMFGLPTLSWPMSKGQQEKFVGVHELSPLSSYRDQEQIDGPRSHLLLDPPPMNPSKDLIERPPSLWDTIPSLRVLLTALVLLLAACGVLYRQRSVLPPRAVAIASAEKSVAALPDPNQDEQDQTPMVREAEPAQETIFPHDAPADDKTPEPVPEDDNDFVHVDEDDVDDLKESNEVKKKARRGKRGGKKAKEREQQAAENRAKRSNSQPTEQVITVAASESTQVSGPLQINSLLIHTDKIIGQGSCGTSVFEGSFEGRDVAVKRMLSQYYELASQEVSFLQQSDDHPNVVRYFCQQKDDHFLYIAVELCQASLFEVWEAEKAKTEERQTQLEALKHTILRDPPKALQQLAAGLYHLHNLRIIHRDIKPQNILVAFPKRGQTGGPRLVISDFGLGKNLPENVSTLVDPTGNAGTSGWKAPELISQPREVDSKHSHSNSQTGGSEAANGTVSGVKRAADIFSLGCLFFWVLTNGVHPYEDENGWQQLRELNIKRDNKKMDVLARWSDSYEPMQLITSMLQHQPENRPTALQILNHPFFWSPETRLAFLCDCSDHFEREPRGTFEDGYAGDSDHLYALESRSTEVIGTVDGRVDFLSKLDRHFVDTLGKQRKYSGNRLLDLLRALRNKKNHYEDMPEDVKKRVGPLADGYLKYWCNRFPRLLMACYDVVHECELQGGDRFKGYFAAGKQ